MKRLWICSRRGSRLGGLLELVMSRWWLDDATLNAENVEHDEVLFVESSPYDGQSSFYNVEHDAAPCKEIASFLVVISFVH